MPSNCPTITHLLVLPRLRVQNANAISSPLTWGFPSITAFTGLLAALQRRLGASYGMKLQAIGVICHGFEPQTNSDGYTHGFHLTRNPVNADGSSAALVEEGRAHLDITLVLGVDSSTLREADEAQREAAVRAVADLVASMRLAGGSVMPPLPGAKRLRPYLVPWPLHTGSVEEAQREWSRLRRRWLPGFALVARDDLLAANLAQLQTTQPDATALDAWLASCALTHRAVPPLPPSAEPADREGADTADAAAAKPATKVEWQVERRPGWIVPIPVGYAALSPLYPPGSVGGTRDRDTHFRFVESVFTLGEWIAPHRLGSALDLLWWPDHEPRTEPSTQEQDIHLYRCRNAYRPAAHSEPLAHLTVHAGDADADTASDEDDPLALL